MESRSRSMVGWGGCWPVEWLGGFWDGQYQCTLLNESIREKCWGETKSIRNDKNTRHHLAQKGNMLETASMAWEVNFSWDTGFFGLFTFLLGSWNMFQHASTCGIVYE